jgi:hypothetical protein
MNGMSVRGQRNEAVRSQLFPNGGRRAVAAGVGSVG